MSDQAKPLRRARRATDPPPTANELTIPTLDAVLAYLAKTGASDLHISAGIRPTARINGDLAPVPGTSVLTADASEQLVLGMMAEDQRAKFDREMELDFAFGRRALGRYRVNAFRERGDVSAALRRIPDQAPSLEELGMPRIIGTFAHLQQGLVLVTGPSGSGKSATLAAIIDKVNKERNVHVITIEDPVEYLHPHDQAIVQQREVGKDTTDFARALRSALREDPDVILIGEMRDLETISAAVSAAETGHLIFGTLHTNSAAGAIDRIIDAFPAHQQTQIRLQVAGSLQAVVSQRLLPLRRGGRVAVAEVLIANPAVRNLVREGKTHQLDSVMQSGIKDGMVIFDMRLAELVRERLVSQEVAMNYCMDPRSFSERLLVK